MDQKLRTVTYLNKILAKNLKSISKSEEKETQKEEEKRAIFVRKKPLVEPMFTKSN